jgi:hypothetical protein
MNLNLHFFVILCYRSLGYVILLAYSKVLEGLILPISLSLAPLIPYLNAKRFTLPISIPLAPLVLYSNAKLFTLPYIVLKIYE